MAWGSSSCHHVSKKPRLTIVRANDMGGYYSPDTCPSVASSKAVAVIEDRVVQTVGTAPAVYRSPTGAISLLFHPLEKNPMGMRKVVLDESGQIKSNTVGPPGGVGSPRGTSPTVSSNKGRDAVVWELDKGAYDNQKGVVVGVFPVLHAYDVESLKPLWSSAAKDADDLRQVDGRATKHLMFSSPTVVDGRVFVAFGYEDFADPRGGVAMYGLL